MGWSCGWTKPNPDQGLSKVGFVAFIVRAYFHMIDGVRSGLEALEVAVTVVCGRYERKIKLRSLTLTDKDILVSCKTFEFTNKKLAPPEFIRVIPAS